MIETYQFCCANQKGGYACTCAERRKNHHDVLCLVLKSLYDRQPVGASIEDFQSFAGISDQLAKYAADLAYPPPKAEP